MGLFRIVFSCLGLFLFTQIGSGQNLVLSHQTQHSLELRIAKEGITLVGARCTSEPDLNVEYTVVDDKVLVNKLQPGHIYEFSYALNYSEINRQYFATQSNSSGEIEVYFNYEIPEWPDSELSPDGTTFGEVEKALKDLIKSAKYTVDYCAYNTNVNSIANELIDATARGVQVRAIVERDNNNFAFSGGVPFPLLEDRNPDLMHNKFIVVDADSDDPNDPYVVSGSMNFTQGQMSADPNHLMIIQDQSLARAYQIEFEEMWGSDGPDFDISNARFGDKKADNTPHEFIIGDIRTEMYFSPSDNTSQQMINALKTAQHHIDLGLLIFTYWDLRDQLLSNLNDGVRIRGIIEDDENSASVVSQLNSNGANIKYHGSNPIYHHKMAIIDGEFENSGPRLISGSHNWTYTAETGNDENTMIFRDPGLAELFKRAFSQYWNTLSTKTKNVEVKEINIFPNPTTEAISIDISKQDQGTAKILNTMGEIVYSGKLLKTIDVSHLISGTYIVYVYTDDILFTGKFIKD